MMFTTDTFPPGPSNDWACSLCPTKYDSKFQETLGLIDGSLDYSEVSEETL